jgi:hypothetical protein
MRRQRPPSSVPGSADICVLGAEVCFSSPSVCTTLAISCYCDILQEAIVSSFFIIGPLRSLTVSLQHFNLRLTVTFHATCRPNLNCCPLGFATPNLIPYPDYVITLVGAQRQFQATYFDVSSAWALRDARCCFVNSFLSCYKC